MIELGLVRTMLLDCLEMIDGLDGVDLDDTSKNPTKAAAREERVGRARTLQLLAHRLELAAQLVMVETWYSRGCDDPLNPDRRH